MHKGVGRGRTRLYPAMPFASYTYMTDDGKTNYFRLKGLAGEAICDADPDCEDGRYCDTGTVGVGRNQCKEVKALGQVCTRGEECSSGRCSALKCAVANECMADPDCGTGRWCNKGLADLGRTSARPNWPMAGPAPGLASAVPEAARSGVRKTGRSAAFASRPTPKRRVTAAASISSARRASATRTSSACATTMWTAAPASGATPVRIRTRTPASRSSTRAKPAENWESWASATAASRATANVRARTSSASDRSSAIAAGVGPDGHSPPGVQRARLLVDLSSVKRYH